MTVAKEMLRQTDALKMLYFQQQKKYLKSFFTVSNLFASHKLLLLIFDIGSFQMSELFTFPA